MAVCVVCGEAKPDAVERVELPLRSVVCTDCLTKAEAEPDVPEQWDVDAGLELVAQAPVEDPRAGVPDVCRYCGAAVLWYETAKRGRPIAIEVHQFPTWQIAPGHRWRVDGNGLAHNLGRANPTDDCNVCHWDACPQRPEPTHSEPLQVLWRNRRRQRFDSDTGDWHMTRGNS